jgi:ethanolaminephosphotransferase
MWIAPNLLTTISLLNAVAVYLLLWYYSPDLRTASPNWTYVVSSVLMFNYQTLDGWDGKQARRTGTSSPLGQLFDHGCDAICCLLCAIFIAGVIQVGSSPKALLVMWMHVVPFYFSNWEEAQTDYMRFGWVGVSEGQLLVMLLLLFSGILGPEVWLTEMVPNSDISYLQGFLIRDGMLLFGTLATINHVRESIISVYHYYKGPGKNQDKTDCIVQFLQYTSYMTLSTLYVFAPSDYYATHPRTVMLTIGGLFGYQLARVIIAHVTHQFLGWFYIVLLYPFVALNEWLIYTPLGRPLIDQTYLAPAYLVLLFLVYAHFVVSVINEICTYLKIRCFVIPAPKKA